MIPTVVVLRLGHQFTKPVSRISARQLFSVDRTLPTADMLTGYVCTTLPEGRCRCRGSIMNRCLLSLGHRLIYCHTVLQNQAV